MLGLYEFVWSNRRWLVGGLLLTLFSSFGQTFYIAQFSGEIRETFGLSDGEFGKIYMYGTLASAITLVWVGKVVDRFSVANVAACVIVCLAMACFAMANVSSTLMLLGVIFTLRLFGQGMMTHTAQTAMGRWYADERGRAIALTSMGHQIGEAVLPTVVLLVVGQIGWRYSWMIAGAVLLALALPTVFGLMRRPRRAETNIEVDQKIFRVPDWERSQVMRDPAFWVLCLGILAPAFIGTSVFFHQVHIGEQKGWAPGTFAASFMMLAGTTVVFTLLGGWLVDRYSSKRLLPVFLLPMAAGCLVLALTQHPLAVFVFMFLLGWSYGFSSAVFGTIWPETYGVKNLGAIRAIAVAAMVFASALGPGVTGEAIDAKVPFDTQLLVMAAYCFVASIGMLIVAGQLLRRQSSTAPHTNGDSD